MASGGSFEVSKRQKVRLPLTGEPQQALSIESILPARDAMVEDYNLEEVDAGTKSSMP